MADPILKLVNHSPPIDFTWMEFGFGVIDPMISRAVAEAIRETFVTSPPRAFLPFQWGDSDGIEGPAVDPLTVYVMLPLGDDGSTDNECYWQFSIDDLIDDFIQLLESDPGKIIADEERALTQKLATAFHNIAQKLEDTLK